MIGKTIGFVFSFLKPSTYAAFAQRQVDYYKPLILSGSPKPLFHALLFTGVGGYLLEYYVAGSN